MTAPVTVGVSLKTYFGNARARAWFAEVAPRLQAHPGIADGRVRFFVIPTYLQIPAAIEAFAETPVLVGAQDVSAHPPGAFTGEITAAELAEVGVQVAEIGHAERRRLFGETDEVTASKAAASLEHGITPVLCIGEDARMSGADAASANLDQLAADLEGVRPDRSSSPTSRSGRSAPPSPHPTTTSRPSRAPCAARSTPTRAAPGASSSTADPPGPASSPASTAQRTASSSAASPTIRTTCSP